MKCVHCGANIPDDQMICPVCGAEVQIVPDYNPLDDVLAREVRGSVEGATRQIRTDDIRRYRREDLTKNINSTRVLSEDEMERIRSNRRKSTNNTERNSAELRRQRQARQQKRLEAAKRKAFAYTGGSCYIDRIWYLCGISEFLYRNAEKRVPCS